MVELLKIPEVIQWSRGNTAFLTKDIDNNLTKREFNKQAQSNERIFGHFLSKLINPNTNSNNQWTTIVGEELVRQVLIQNNHIIISERKKCIMKRQDINKQFEIDIETDKCIVEVKTGTYFTHGTAHEKILAVPYKYAGVSEYFNKPLWIVCVADDEQYAKRELLADDSRKEFYNFYKSKNIHYIFLSDLISTSDAVDPGLLL
jgi:hypothetical protein